MGAKEETNQRFLTNLFLDHATSANKTSSWNGHRPHSTETGPSETPIENVGLFYDFHKKKIFSDFCLVVFTNLHNL